MDICTWAEEITKEVFSEWKNKYSFWKPGFAVFYSPIKEQSDLLILSYNPGGGGADFKAERTRFENGDFSLPKENQYTANNPKFPLAKKLAKLFGDKSQQLAKSVAFPILFFRSKDAAQWQTCDKVHRKDMEELCFHKSLKILEKLKPKKILIVGFATFDLLKKHGNYKITNETEIPGSKQTIIHRASLDGIPVFCTLHLSGYHINNADFETMKHHFAKFIS